MRGKSRDITAFDFLDVSPIKASQFTKYQKGLTKSLHDPLPAIQTCGLIKAKYHWALNGRLLLKVRHPSRLSAARTKPLGGPNVKQKTAIHLSLSRHSVFSVCVFAVFNTYVMIWFSVPASTKTPSTNRGTEEKLCWVHCLPSSKLILCGGCQKAFASQTRQQRWHGNRHSPLGPRSGGWFRLGSGWLACPNRQISKSQCN